MTERRSVHYHTEVKKIITIIALVLLGGGTYWYTHRPAAPQTPPAFDKTTHSTTDPSSIWVVVNKKHPLAPTSYVPENLVTPNVPLRVPGSRNMSLRKDTAEAVEAMFAAAKKDGIDLMVSSGYRSYDNQVNLYAGYVRTSSQAEADKFSARPGHSEHQTGLALDVEPTSKTCEVEQCFGDTPEGKWVAAHAYEYGFIIRYTPDKVAVTGYSSEPWHIRYVGTSLAGELHRTGIKTLEEFFDISGGNY